MKYNDNGEYKDIYVKTFDTLPVGAEVDYDGQTVPTGWTEVSDTIYTGSLQGTNSITLNNVKRFLKIYATGNQQTTGIDNIIYEIDTSLQDVTYGSGIVIAWDEVGGLDYYISESKFDKTNNTFTHTRTGYLKISSNSTFNARNTNDRYVIYRIDTYD